MHLHPKREPTWEVVDHKEISQVPSFFGDSDVEVARVFPYDVSQTTTFSASSSSPPASEVPDQSRSPTPVHRRPSTFSRCSSLINPSTFHFPLHIRSRSRQSACSSSSSTTSSDSEEDEREADLRRKKRGSVSLPLPQGFTLPQMKDALRFARQRLVESEEFKKLGANVLFFESWSVTLLRKGEQYRLQIKYSGRPAIATYTVTPPSAPPFLEMLASL